TDGRANDSAPVWGPQGRELVFVSDRERNLDIFALDVAGGHAANLTRTPVIDEGIWTQAWSPDGQEIVFTSRAQAGFDGEDRQAIGIAGALLQAGLMMGIFLLAVRRWRLPFGSLTFILGVSGLLTAVLSEHFQFLPGAFAAGILADLLLKRLQPLTG